MSNWPVSDDYFLSARAGGDVSTYTDGSGPVSFLVNTADGWLEIEASTAYLISYLVVQFAANGSGFNNNRKLRFSSGPPGFEEDAVFYEGNLGGKASNGDRRVCLMQDGFVEVPAGSRLSVNVTEAGVNGVITALFYSGGFGRKNLGTTCREITPIGGIEGIGAAARDPGAYGPWEELVTSLAHPVTQLTLVGQPHTATATTSAFSIQLAVGASGSESLIATLSGETTNAERGGMRFVIPTSLPAGARLSARIASVTNSANQRELDLSLFGYGGPQTE